MPGPFDELPPMAGYTSPSTDHEHAEARAPQPEPDDDYEIAKARELEDAGHALASRDGLFEGPFFASALDLEEGITAFYISCRDENGHVAELGGVPHDVSFAQLIRMDKILFALSGGARDFTARPHHPRLGLMSKHALRFRLDPDRSLEVARALEAYEGAGVELDDTGEEEMLRPELHDHLTQYSQLMEAPIDRGYRMLDHAGAQYEQQLVRLSRMGDIILGSIERAGASQMEAAATCADIVLSTAKRGAELVQSSERHSAGIAIAAKRLELETPIGERLLARLLDAGADVDPMTMHRVMFGEKMTFGEMVMDVVARKAKDFDLFGGGGPQTQAKTSSTTATDGQVVEAEQVPPAQIASGRKCSPAEFVLAVRQVDEKDATAVREVFEAKGYTLEDLGELSGQLPKRLVRAYRKALEPEVTDAVEVTS